ncbi:MAG: YpdA family putative bacillithiol disulfide reductase, partial [Phaeodactylibacter sp.]|nr:YpdA family putative bacillithiol disulfide reductase [Phaeodactylibacter sp.]
MNSYDLIIIGGGPTGINCGVEAQRQGLNFLILEKGVLVNSIYHFPVNMTFFSTAQKLEIGNTPFIAHSDKPTRREALEYYRRLVDFHQLPIQMYERVLTMQSLPPEQGYEIRTSKGVYQTRAVIVATGYYDHPRLLNIPGEDLPKVKHYFDDAHPYIGQDVLVIGARNSACDVALETWQKGASVTMAIRSNQIYDRVKYWIKPNIENRIKEGSIKAFFNTQVLQIEPDRTLLETPEGKKWIDNDVVLAMTGYRPDYAFLEQLGIRIQDDDDRQPVFDPDTL